MGVCEFALVVVEIFWGVVFAPDVHDDVAFLKLLLFAGTQDLRILELLSEFSQEDTC